MLLLFKIDSTIEEIQEVPMNNVMNNFGSFAFVAVVAFVPIDY